MLGDSRGRLRACAEGLAIDPEDAELCSAKRSSIATAARRPRPSLLAADPDPAPPRAVCQRRQGIYGHLTRRNLAALAAERGEHAEAARLWARCSPNAPATARRTAKLARLDSA